MGDILIVNTSWYEKYILEMHEVVMDILAKEGFGPAFETYTVPGALELAACAKQKINKYDNYIGVIFNGIVIRGSTTHYDLVTQETFRSIGMLADAYYKLAIINNVICVENESQLKDRLIKNSQNNARALIQLINEKSS